MGSFLHQVLVQDETLAVSTTRTDDLPVNPLSMILLTIKNLNDTGTITDWSLLTTLLDQIARVEVLFQGSAVVSGSLADLARLNGLLIGRGPRQLRAAHTNNDIRGITVPILLGRKPYWLNECFPAVRRGELQLQITSSAAQTGLDTLILQIETVELPGATPSQFLKYTTISKTPSATGDHDVDLPIGNRIAGALLFGTTVPNGTSYNASFGQTRLLVDNVESMYARTNWETLNGLAQLRCEGSIHNADHQHVSDVAAAYAQFQLTDEQVINPSFLESYGFLDFDPLTDGNFFLDTKGRARVHLRITADAADAIRILPLELVDVVNP